MTKFCPDCQQGAVKVEGEEGSYWECESCGRQWPSISITLREPEPADDECEACWQVLQFLGRLATDDNMRRLAEAKEHASDPDNHDPECEVLGIPEQTYAWDQNS